MQDITEMMPNSPDYTEKKKSFEEMTQEEIEQQKADWFNASPGDLNSHDGYNCEICKNKGYIASVKQNEMFGYFYQSVEECECRRARKSVRNMERSGLKELIHTRTFEKWVSSEEWQKRIYESALEYSRNPEKWLYIGGTPGCGKTHLCAAICHDLMYKKRKRVRYMQWREETAKLKAMFEEPQKRQAIIDEYKQAEVLYIDDLFKSGKNTNKSAARPSPADINLAFEILNYRYNNPKLLTIISSELSTDMLNDIDEGLGSRIYERSKVMWISNDGKKNYRMRNVEKY